MTTIRMTSGNAVAAMPPAPGDLFVVTLLAGKVVFVQPADEYGKALSLAEAFAGRVPASGQPFVVKVLGASFPELLAWQGTTQEAVAAALPPETAEADRQLILDACRHVLRDCDDATVRRDAYDLLLQMGALLQ